MAKKYFNKHFCDQGLYFLGIETAHSKHGAILSQAKYALDFLHETGLFRFKHLSSSMEPMLICGQALDEDVFQHRRLVGILLYLIATRLDIAFVVDLVSQLSQPQK